MNLLITGVNGIVGNEIAYLLSKNKNYKLFLFTNKKNRIKKKQVKIYYQDLTKPISYKFKVDVIIHCAAKNPLSLSGNSSKDIYTKNIKMINNLIKFSNKRNVKKIIFFSAMDGQSKSKAEKLLCRKENKFKSICLRLPGIFVLNFKRERPLIISLVKKIIKNEDVAAFNLNKKFNNIIDSEEIVKFINFYVNKKKVKSDIYNFSSSRPIKFINVLNLIKIIFKSKSKIIYKEQKKNSFIISNKKIQLHYNFRIASTKDIIARCCKKILINKYKII